MASDDKELLRLEAKVRLKELDSVEKTSASQIIAEKILSSLQWKSAHHVFLFAALACEPNLTDLWLPRNRGKRSYYLPRLSDDGLAIEFRLANDLSQLERSTAGFFEPPPCAQAHDPNDAVELILVPGLAFSQSGVRLGRGRGHYDRMLPNYPDARWMGVAFSCQIVPKLSFEEHDQHMHAIVTEAGLLDCNVD